MAGRTSSGGCAGQALVEMVVGLVAILVLFAVLVQLGTLGLRRNRALAESRRIADTRALDSDYRSGGPTYIRNWRKGADGKEYSQDDEMTPGDYRPIANDVVKRANPDELEEAVSGNRITRLYYHKFPLNEFRLVAGHARSGPVTILPVVRRLMVRADVIDISCETWLVWGEGVY